MKDKILKDEVFIISEKELAGVGEWADEHIVAMGIDLIDIDVEELEREYKRNYSIGAVLEADDFIKWMIERDLIKEIGYKEINLIDPYDRNALGFNYFRETKIKERKEE